jgi:hypothetical protein
MPAVDIESQEQYSKALDVLTRVGGTFQGVGAEKRYLLVTEAQYQALIAAGVVKQNGAKERSRGTKKTNRNRKAQGSAGSPQD